MLKKIISAVVCLTICSVFFCACDNHAETLDGVAEIKNAAVLYEALNGGHIYMTDNKAESPSTVEMNFRYTDDILSYNIVETTGNRTYYEYYNGSEQTYTYSDATEWVVWTVGDGNFYQYTRNAKHSYVSSSLIYSLTGLNATLVEDASGGKKITFIYDVSKLSDAMKAQYASVGAVGSVEVVYLLDKDGYVTEETQHLIVSPTDGSANVLYSYTYSFSQFNDIAEIEKPVAVWEVQ